MLPILWKTSIKAQTRGSVGPLRSVSMDQFAQAKGKKIETELQILQIDQDLRSDVAKELREIQGKVAELVERKVAAEDQLKRIPIAATRHSSSDVGGVIGPSEPLMLVVPEDDPFLLK